MSMQLDADMRVIADAIAQRPALDLSTLDPVQYRAVVERAGWPTRRVELPRVEEILIPSARGDMRARLYVPHADRILPLTVFAHGGGFVICSIDTHDNYCRTLAVAADCAVLSVDYRLAPEHRFPAAFDDVVTALRWAHANAAQLGCDPAKIAIAGDSAGANLAAAAALYAEVPLCHQLLLYPAIDPHADSETYRSCADAVLLRADTMRWFWAQYLNESDRDDPRAALLRCEYLARTPATTIIAAEYDPLRAEGEQFAAALRAVNVDVEWQRFDGVPHGFATMIGLVAKADAALNYAAQRLQTAFLIRR